MQDISTLILWVPGLLFALTVHEYAHGRVAYALGDPTPKRAGRLTFNPIAHLDPIGTVMIFLFHIGWAKPVPVNPYFFRNPRRDIVLVSAAGPLANLITALAAGTILKVLTFTGQFRTLLWMMILYTMDINVILMVFNLIPIPPLDGSKVLFGLLKTSQATMAAMERIGPLILLMVIVLGSISGFNVLWMLLYPFVLAFHKLFV